MSWKSHTRDEKSRALRLNFICNLIVHMECVFVYLRTPSKRASKKALKFQRWRIQIVWNLLELKCNKWVWALSKYLVKYREIYSSYRSYLHEIDQTLNWCSFFFHFHYNLHHRHSIYSVQFCFLALCHTESERKINTKQHTRLIESHLGNSTRKFQLHLQCSHFCLIFSVHLLSIQITFLMTFFNCCSALVFQTRHSTLDCRYEGDFLSEM